MAVWSPDSKEIAFLQGGPDSLIYFSLQRLAVVPAAGGPVRVLSRALDRNFVHPSWSGDGKSVYVQLEDDGSMLLARASRDGSSIDRVLGGRRSISAVTTGGSHVAIIQSTPTHPDELFAVDGDSVRQLSDANPWLRDVQLADQESIAAKSKDGTIVHGFLMRPVNSDAREPLPTILRLHGGPVSQWENGFELSWQMLAAHGFAVVGMNPRGSSGRGFEWAKAIYAHWGEKDVEDVLAGVDYLVAHRLADPKRLAVGGWSYGGELTDYVIARDTRFRAAISGAGIGNVFAGFGTDQYVREYTAELGLPWKHPGGVDARVVSIPARGSHHDAHALHGGRPGLQRAAAELRADVPGAPLARRGEPARDLSRRAPRAHPANIPRGSTGALHCLVRLTPGREERRPGDHVLIAF